MGLQQLIDEYEKEQKNYQEWADSFKRKLDALSKMNQPTAEEFYENITSDKFYTASFENKKYEYILGGDGRSSAWSEWREGIVLVVRVKECYFIPNELITALTNYVKEKYKQQYDHLEIISVNLNSFK